MNLKLRVVLGVGYERVLEAFRGLRGLALVQDLEGGESGVVGLGDRRRAGLRCSSFNGSRDLGCSRGTLGRRGSGSSGGGSGGLAPLGVVERLIARRHSGSGGERSGADACLLGPGGVYGRVERCLSKLALWSRPLRGAVRGAEARKGIVSERKGVVSENKRRLRGEQGG